MSDSPVFAELPEGRRNWAIASIHGDVQRLARVHDALAARLQPSDNVVYLGNLIGHGQVAAAVHELLLFRRALLASRLADDAGAIAYLRGSQEEMWHKLLQIQFAPNPQEVLEWMLTQGVGPTLQAYGGTVADGRAAVKGGAVSLSRWTNRLRATMREMDGHERLMSALRRAAFTRDSALLFVSAGIDPSRPLAHQRDTFWWGSRGFETMEAGYDGYARVVRGADAQRRGMMLRDGVASIDAGCGFGGPLLAACFGADGSLVDLIEA